MQQFDAIFEIFGRAVFEAIEVKGRSMFKFEVTTLKFCYNFWKCGCQPQKIKADLCLTNNVKVLIYLTLTSLFLQYYKRFQNQAYLWAWHNSRCPPKIFCQSEELSLSIKKTYPCPKFEQRTWSWPCKILKIEHSRSNFRWDTNS